MHKRNMYRQTDSEMYEEHHVFDAALPSCQRCIYHLLSPRFSIGIRCMCLFFVEKCALSLSLYMDE